MKASLTKAEKLQLFYCLSMASILASTTNSTESLLSKALSSVEEYSSLAELGDDTHCVSLSTLAFGCTAETNATAC